MKGNTTHNNIRLWNVANLALFIGAVFCLRHYIINTTIFIAYLFDNESDYRYIHYWFDCISY